MYDKPRSGRPIEIDDIAHAKITALACTPAPEMPVVCYDEWPCFLIGETVAPLPMTTGKVTKEHYAYKKNGSCKLLAAIEPLTGEHLALVRTQRTKKEYAEFCQALVAAWPEAKRIRLVQDRPKSASWLNRIEIEFSALARECLHSRITSQEFLECEVWALVKGRAEKQLKINWRFR